MEFVRTVIRSKVISGSLYRQISALLCIYFIFAAILIYFNTGTDEGPILSHAAAIVSSGRYSLQGAMGITADQNGNIYVADSGNNRVVVFDKRGFARKIIGAKSKNSKAGYPLRFPMCLALSADKRLFVGSGTGQILVFDKNGKLLDTLPHEQDKLNLPVIKALAMTTDRSGNLYVSDRQKYQIVIFDSNGNLRLIFGEKGYLPGEISFVNGIAVDEANRQIVVLDSNNLRLEFFNFDGKYLSEMNLNKSGPNLFIAPRGLAYNPDKKIFYITETLLDKVIALDEKGNLAAQTKDVALSYPHGIFMGPDKLLYVTNREGREISVLNP